MAVTAKTPLRFKVKDPRFQRVQRLFASGRTDKADEGRALLREILKEAPLSLKGRHKRKRVET